jgi:hypothetical protein
LSIGKSIEKIQVSLKYDKSIEWVLYMKTCGHAVVEWLRHCATNRKVAGSIPDDVTGIFHWHNSSGRTGVDSVSNINEYQECFVGVKAAGA